MLKELLNDEQLRLYRQLIAESQTVVITCHTNADGDAVGSALATANFLRHKGKEAHVVFNDTPGENLSFIPGYRDELVFDNQRDGTPDTHAEA